MLILCRHKEKVLDEKLLDHILSASPTYAGVALVVEEKDGTKVLCGQHFPEPPTKAQIMEIETDYLDCTTIWHFGRGNVDPEKDDVQPLVVLKSGEDLKLVALLTGDFNQFGIAESSHSNAFFAVNKAIIPDIGKIWRLTGQDLNKIAEYLRDPSTANTVQSWIGQSGLITFLAANGEIMSFQKGLTVKEFDWGWASDTLGFGEKQPEPKKDEPKTRALGGLNKLKPPPIASTTPIDKKAEKIEEKPKTTGLKPPPTTVPAVAQGKDTAIPATVLNAKPPQNDAEFEAAGYIRLPEGIKDQKTASKWYRKRTPDGYIPPNPLARPWVKPKAGTIHKDLSQLEKVVAQNPKGETSPVPGTGPQPEVREKVDADEEIPGFVPNHQKHSLQTEFFKREDVQKGMTDRASREITEPLSQQSTEYPPFAVQMDLPDQDIHVMDTWTWPSLLDFSRKFPNAAASVIRDLLHEVYELKRNKAAKGAAPAKAEEPKRRALGGLK